MMQVATVFMGLFAIMNPIANTPIFLSLTSGDDPATKRKIARRALVLTFVIVLSFVVLIRKVRPVEVVG